MTSHGQSYIGAIGFQWDIEHLKVLTQGPDTNVALLLFE